MKTMAFEIPKGISCKEKELLSRLSFLYHFRDLYRSFKIPTNEKDKEIKRIISLLKRLKK